jgi:hypothetical protein
MTQTDVKMRMWNTFSLPGIGGFSAFRIPLARSASSDDQPNVRIVIRDTKVVN